MQYNIAVVHHQPAAASLALYAAFLFMLFSHTFHDSLCQSVQHAIAGAVAEHEIIGEGCDVFQFKQ